MKNKALRDSYKPLFCVVCGSTPCDPCHIKTYAVTGADDPLNLVPMCRQHHSEQHNLGVLPFMKKYASYKYAIEKLGWEVFNGKLFNENLKQY